MKTMLAVSCLLAACYSTQENLGFAAVGEPRWSVSLGGRANDRGMTIAIDSLGDVIAGGEFIGPADFGSGLDTVGGPWGFITTRVASDGSERWTLKFIGTGSTSNSWVTDVAIGPQDTVIVAGGYMGTVDFGGQVLTSPPDKSTVFIATFSANGQLLWVRSFNDFAQNASVAVNGSGTVFVTGGFAGSTLNFNGQFFTERDGDPDAFLVAYDVQGNLLWGTAFQATLTGSTHGAGPVGTGVALATNGDVLVTGSFSGPASFGGPVLSPEARSRTFLTRFRGDGLYIASQAVGPVSPIVAGPPDIAVDATGHIVIQQIEQDYSKGPNSEQGLGLPTLRVFDDDMNKLWWSHLVNTSRGSPYQRALATTPGGLIVSSTWTDSPFNADDRSDVRGWMEVVAFDENATAGMSTFGSRLIGALSATLVVGTAASSTGAVAFAGYFGGTVDFGTGAVSTRGQDDTDIFIISVDPPPELAASR